MRCSTRSLTTSASSTAAAGVMLLLMGVARMGGVIKFIPSPVVVGFTAGIGVIIFVGQWSDFLGLPITSKSNNPSHQDQYSQELRLSGETIAKIFTGVITSWADPQIKRENPGLVLPARKIVPVVRGDGGDAGVERRARGRRAARHRRTERRW